MDVVYRLGDLRVIDLTKPLDPKTETRRCHLFRFNTGGLIPDFHTIMDLTSHLGTHCECPYHHNDDWPSVAEVPLDRFLGRALYVDFKDAEPRRDQRLRVSEETAVWLRDHKAKCIGFGDGVSVESSNEDIKPFHDVLLAENITFLEVLKNLDRLESDVFFMSYAPLPIMGLDSCPVRAYAIEGLPGFTG